MPVLPIGTSFHSGVRVTFCSVHLPTPSPSLRPPRDPMAFRIKSDLLRIASFMHAAAFFLVHFTPALSRNALARLTCLPAWIPKWTFLFSAVNMLVSMLRTQPLNLFLLASSCSSQNTQLRLYIFGEILSGIQVPLSCVSIVMELILIVVLILLYCNCLFISASLKRF